MILALKWSLSCSLTSPDVQVSLLANSGLNSVADASPVDSPHVGSFLSLEYEKSDGCDDGDEQGRKRRYARCGREGIPGLLRTCPVPAGTEIRNVDHKRRNSSEGAEIMELHNPRHR